MFGVAEHSAQFYNMILFSKTASTTKLKKCDYYSIGDSYCDDSNNIADCDFDGGDCCLTPIINQYCSECWCYVNPANHTSYVSGKNQRSKLLINIFYNSDFLKHFVF